MVVEIFLRDIGGPGALGASRYTRFPYVHCQCSMSVESSGYFNGFGCLMGWGVQLVPSRGSLRGPWCDRCAAGNRTASGVEGADDAKARERELARGRGRDYFVLWL